MAGPGNTLGSPWSALDSCHAPMDFLLVQFLSKMHVRQLALGSSLGSHVLRGKTEGRLS
jgi:hypothetical protein